MDPITIGLLVGGGAGLLKGAKNEKKMKEHAKFREAALRYSPWTGMGDPGDLNLPGMLESGLQGGALGASVGNMLGPSTAATTMAPDGTNVLGGKDMALEMGKMQPDFMQMEGFAPNFRYLTMK